MVRAKTHVVAFEWAGLRMISWTAGMRRLWRSDAALGRSGPMTFECFEEKSDVIEIAEWLGATQTLGGLRFGFWLSVQKLQCAEEDALP